MVIVLLSITVILSAATFLTTQNFDRSTNDVGFALGHMTLQVLDENGYVTDYRQTDNLIVNDGWETLVQTAFDGDYTFVDCVSCPGDLTGDAADPFSRMAIGSGGATGPQIIDGGVNTVLSDCVPVTFAGIEADNAAAGGGGESEIVFTIFAEFDGATCSDAQSDDIDEAAILNTGNEMFARNTFNPVSALGSQDVLEIEWTFTFTGNAPPA